MGGLTGKHIKLFFDDTGKVLVKEGIVTDESSNFIQIQTDRGLQAIPMIKVVRVEVLG